MPQPRARVDVVYDTHFGTTIADPYRWLEVWQSDEARAWTGAQAAYTRTYLDALPVRPALHARIGELTNAGAELSHLQQAGGRAFYIRRDPGENLGKLVMRLGADAPEQVLLDPQALSGAMHTALDWYRPSPDGRRVAYGISSGGSEDAVLHVLDTDAARSLDVAIPGARFPSTAWLPDSTAFSYHRLREPAPGEAPGARYADTRTYLHRLGSDPAGDLPVLGRDLNPHLPLAPQDTPILILPRASVWMLACILHGARPDLTLYAALRSGLADPATCPWVPVCDVPEAIVGFDVAGDTIYLRTYAGAPCYKIVATSLTRPDLAHAPVVVPESPAVVEDLKVVGDWLLIREMENGLGRLRRVPLAGGDGGPIALPFAGSIRAPGGGTDWAGEPGTTQMLFVFESWTVAPRIYRLDVARGVLADTGWWPASPVDTRGIEAHEVEIVAKDGTRIPLSIIHRTGLARDGAHPTLLRAYGAYGISLLPTYDPAMLAWYERGGVYAIAHVRGGGERGRDWHRAGCLLNKQQTIDDFIAAAEYLVAQGYTQPARLAGAGRSAGGIPSGGALAARPDLWRVVLIEVGVTNMLRLEYSDNGPANTPEFGSVATEDGFQALRIADSYHQICDEVAYPAVMLTTGLNDRRVVPWMATKMAARLQAATTSGRPILLRVEEQAGHGATMGSTKAQVSAELADKLAFMLEQFGLGTPTRTGRHHREVTDAL